MPVLCLPIALLLAVQTPLALPPAPPAAAAAPAFDYPTMLARLKSGDTSVDFAALRLASVRQPGFNGYNSLDHKAVGEALSRNDFAAVRKIAETHLAGEYLDENAHLFAMVAARGLNDKAGAAFHRAVLRGLIGSIRDSGDGAGPASAYQVIGVDEEYALLASYGLKSEGQSLRMEQGKQYDVLQTVDPQTGAKKDLWFDIGRFFGRGF